MKLKNERNYEFRKRLLEIHKSGLRDRGRVPSEDEFVITDGCVVQLPEDAGEVMLTAAKDFTDYMFTSMETSVRLQKGSIENAVGHIIVHSPNPSEEELGEANGYMGYRIVIGDDIQIYSHDERGTAQALYHLEDLMSTAKGPYLKKTVIARKASFSPRMIHSGYGMDSFPNEHLSAIAHAGMDAILLFVKGVNCTTAGYVDFNELVYRAGKYGIDVYAYSYLKSEMHPDDEGAEEYYDGLYGSLFKACPDLKGIVLVGESVEFPSKDPRVSKPGRVKEGQFPSGKPRPGWWPCEDYGKWLSVVQKSIYKYNSNADIVFWTYNWGWAPEEERLRLLEKIPKGISLQVTYEMFEPYKVGGATNIVADYTISFAGPGNYFTSEAKKAKELGIRLYTMANTAGLTWDFGLVPYEPFPFQWLKRYRGLLEAKEKWGLCGVMESHHFGFWPSFISNFEKEIFFAPKESPDVLLDHVLTRFFGEKNVTVLREALEYWSEAITYYLPTNEDQYGAFRIGPAFPLCLERQMKPQPMPQAHHKGICYVGYTMDWSTMVSQIDDKCTLIGAKIESERKSLETMKEWIEKGNQLLQSIEDKNEELLYLENLGKYILCCVVTGIHAKRWYVLKSQLKIESDTERVKTLIEEMETLAKNEIENTLAAIPLVQCDSRLGWEPSQEYMGDEERLRWKIQQVEFMLNVELGEYKKRLALSLDV